jgi:hypothetical protein
MLDAFIIDQIRKERERRDSGFQPLRIETPRPSPEDPFRREPERREEDKKERGVVIIDYSI